MFTFMALGTIAYLRAFDVYRTMMIEGTKQAHLNALNATKPIRDILPKGQVVKRNK